VNAREEKTMSANTFEMIRMSKRSITRLFVGAVIAVGAGLVLSFAALGAALASDAIDIGGSYVIDVNGGSGAWTALALVIVGSLAILGGTIAAVVSWLGALLNTWPLEDKMWFVSLLALGLLGFGVVAMIAYVLAGPDGTKQSEARPGIAGAVP
jgi:ABC-type Na+ efflux pump permease subunit